MSYGTSVLDLSFTAETDLSEKQYYWVELSGDNQVDVCDGAADTPIGILQNKPAAGEVARVRVLGVSPLVVGAEVTYGSNVGTDANGKGVTKTQDTEIINGWALEGADTAGDLATVLVGCGPKQIGV